MVDSTNTAESGIVSGQTINTANSDVSAKKWEAQGVTINITGIVSDFLSYAKSKEDVVFIEPNELDKIESNKINIINITGDPITIIDQLETKENIVLMINGENDPSKGSVIFKKGDYNNGTINHINHSLTVLATGTITFDTDIIQANGIYVANNIDLGSTNKGLKIKGNIITNSLTNERTWVDPLKPGFFMVFDPSHYLNLVGLLSEITYDWKQLQ